MQAQRISRFHNAAPVAHGQRFDQAKNVAAVHRAQHVAHACFLQLPAAKGNRLVGERERIAHGAARGPRQQAQGLGLERHAFGAQHAC